MMITNIGHGRRSGRTMISVKQSGRSVTLHLVKNVDVHGRTWNIGEGSFTTPVVDPKVIDALDPRPAVKNEEVAVS